MARRELTRRERVRELDRKRESERDVERERDRELERDIPTSLTDMLNMFAKIRGVDSVVVVGRDGFVIEQAGSETSDLVEMDALGASLANMVDAMESMGTELDVSRFSDMYIQYGRAIILGVGVGDAILAIVSPTDKTLGTIRYYTRKYASELRQFV